MDKNQRQFLADTEDLIEQILADLDELRRPAKQDNVQKDLLDGIFRSAHRVKGSAGSFGLSGLSEIAHEFEGLLGAVRAGQTPLNETVLQTCDLAAIALMECLHFASTGDVEPTHLPLLERLRTFAQDSGLAPDPDLETNQPVALRAEQGFVFDQLRTTSGPSLSNFVRIDTDELDRLISSTHDLFRNTIRALDLASSQTAVGQEGQEEFGQLDAQIRKSFLRVGSDLIGLRLISIGPILQRAARAGRAVGRSRLVYSLPSWSCRQAITIVLTATK